VAPTRFVHRDYRHLEADVVLHAPLLDPQGRRLARHITIYVLIEHQSEPDPLMLLRVLEYVVPIFKKQLQEWDHAHGSREGFRFQPVLPVVLYTGTRTWEGLGQLVDLVAQAELVADVTPSLRPLFLNLGETETADLESRGGAFGWLLRLAVRALPRRTRGRRAARRRRGFFPQF
jgi:Putative transposase, YhgA-like